jgi:DNA-directed RNA polymerase I, II, and III subunit RPABC2
MTKYEHARVLGTRALQISMGAPIMVPMDGSETDFLAIAIKELEAKCLPMIVKRYYPNGSYVEYDVNDLEVTPV